MSVLTGLASEFDPIQGSKNLMANLRRGGGASIALILAVSACAPTDGLPGAASAEPVRPKATRSAAPEFGSYGFDTDGMDLTIAPGNDFYGYANGNWSKSTAIPPDKSNYGPFQILDDLSHRRTKEILEAEAGDPRSKIGAAYRTYLDVPAIEAKGFAPIQPWLEKIKNLRDRASYPQLVADADRDGISGPFAVYVAQDKKNSQSYALYIRQSGLGMPDREYYLSGENRFAAIRSAYQHHLESLMQMVGVSNVSARAKRIIDFETEIARAHWTATQNRDVSKTYNVMSIADLERSAPGFEFRSYLKKLSARTDRVVVVQPSAIAQMAAAIRAAPLDVLKDQLLVRTIDNFADVLPTKVDQERFRFYGTVLSGTPEQAARWQRAVDFTVESLTDEVSKRYVAKYFAPGTKRVADEMVRNVIEAMGHRIDALDWMSPETKAKARAKLAAFTPRIGYPSRWHSYSSLKIVDGDAFGNELRANRWAHDDNFSKLGHPIRRWEWGLAPMTVNAQANFELVAITFPAAILQPPFFDPNADPAVNYGGIGAVIGHELSHHFDDQGAQYDMKGNLADWWTAADSKAFAARTNALAAQYDRYEPFPGLHVNGRLTLGENVADLAGLTVAYDAYKKSINAEGGRAIEGTTGDQRFFLGWAQVWRRNYRDENLRQRLLTDPHAPSQQRTWVVRNLDPWYSAFAVGPDAALYLKPSERVRIW